MNFYFQRNYSLNKLLRAYINSYKVQGEFLYCVGSLYSHVTYFPSVEQERRKRWMDFKELLRALCFKEDREFISLVESEFIEFINYKHPDEDKRTPVIEFPAMTSHFRWMIHATAARFGLKSTSIGWGFDKPLRVERTQDSKYPLSHLDLHNLILSIPLVLSADFVPFEQSVLNFK
jgi:hypothetical protein